MPGVQQRKQRDWRAEIALQQRLGTDPVTQACSRSPGRCPACGGHLATQGHIGHCPHGFNSWMALMPDGTWLHNPPHWEPPAEPPPDPRYGPPGTTEPAGRLPRTCTACGGYPSRTGSGHLNLCPYDGQVT